MIRKILLEPITLKTALDENDVTSITDLERQALVLINPEK